MDDILVNCDPERARNATITIAELANTHQVLYFTCHPEASDIFKKNGININQIMIGDKKNVGAFLPSAFKLNS
jgi:uncharacterized protein YhaN